MCFGVLENASPTVLETIWLVFVCAHARSYIFMTYENVSGSFKTPSCPGSYQYGETGFFGLVTRTRGCENTFCCLTPTLLTVLHVLLPLLLSLT
jgi:hypothetical protein